MQVSEVEKLLLTPSFYNGQTAREIYCKKLAYIKQLIAGRTPLNRDGKEKLLIKTKTDMEAVVDALYFNNIVDLSEFTHHLTDKVLVWKLLEDSMGRDEALFYHPNTIGLKEFLEKYNLINEDFSIKNQALVAAALDLEFPNGFIAKPNLSYNTLGKTKGFYFEKEEFLNDLMDYDELYRADEWHIQYKFTEGAYSFYSPEKFLLQDRLSGKNKSGGVKKAQEFAEIRVHSYQDRVIEGATSSRWDGTFRFNRKIIKRVNEFIGEFLLKLPKEMIAHQAWSFDISYIEGEPLKIIEINSNRGSHSDHWSGFLRRPVELTSYIRHFEKYYNCSFTGLSGFLLRNYLGNYFQWRRRIIKRKKTRLQKIYNKIIPPWPFPRWF